VVLVEGTATRGAETLRFIAKADQQDLLDGDGNPDVAGCSFGATPGGVGANIDDNGTVTLTIVPSVWFDQVEFSYALSDGDGGTAEGGSGDAGDGADGAASSDRPIDIGGTLAWQAFVRGMKKGTAYLFSYGK
jgi:hypothetical protein